MVSIGIIKAQSPYYKVKPPTLDVLKIRKLLLNYGLDKGYREGEKVYTLQEKIDLINPQFLLYTPPNYNDTSIKSFPLIIFLHGIGEAGKDINLVKRHGLPKFLGTFKNLNFIVIAPQCPPKTLWDHPEKLHEFLCQVLGKFKINSKQVYLTGLSSGGSGTWAWAKDYPEDFAAIAPVSGACYWDISTQLESMPVWIFHGLQDKTIGIHEDSVLYRKLKSLGNRVRFTVFPKGGHNIWDKTYSNPDLYSWFLNYEISKSN